MRPNSKKVGPNTSLIQFFTNQWQKKFKGKVPQSTLGYFRIIVAELIERVHVHVKINYYQI